MHESIIMAGNGIGNLKDLVCNIFAEADVLLPKIREYVKLHPEAKEKLKPHLVQLAGCSTLAQLHLLLTRIYVELSGYNAGKELGEEVHQWMIRVHELIK